MHMEVCSVWWTHKTFSKTHWNQTLPVPRLWPQLLPLWPPCPPQETPHARLSVSASRLGAPLARLSHPPPNCLTHFLHVHFNLDSAGLNLWIYIIQTSIWSVVDILIPPLSLPRVRPKECEHFFFFPGDAKQTLLTDTFNVMRTREHVN